MKGIARLCVAAAMIGLLGMSTGASGAQPEKKKVTIAIAGTSSQIYFLAVNVAKAKNYFKEEGVDVETVDFAGGAKSLEAMIGGSADIDAGSYEHTFQIQAKGRHVQCFALFNRSVGTVLAIAKAKAKDFKSIRDLKGMNVGVSAPGFSATNIFLNLILVKNGLKPSDVHVIGVGNGPVAYAGIENGKIDAISSVDPVITQLEAHNLIQILVDSRTDKGLTDVYGGEYPSGCLLATGDFVKNNPNTVQALTNAIERALKFLHASNADQILAVLPPNIVGPDRALYRASLEKNLNTVAKAAPMSESSIKNVLRVVSDADPSVASAKIDIGATYTNEFIKKALDKLK